MSLFWFGPSRRTIALDQRDELRRVRRVLEREERDDLVVLAPTRLRRPVPLPPPLPPPVPIPRIPDAGAPP